MQQPGPGFMFPPGVTRPDDMTQQRILIVEDEPDLRRGLEMNLRAEGYSVLSAATGDIGVRQALDQRPDLILLDVMLPGLNGFDVCRELRRKGYEARSE